MKKVKKGETIAVWFSCGAASAVAAKKTIEKYPQAEIRILNNPILEEHGDNQRFLTDCEEWLGRKIERVVNPDYPNFSCEEIWGKGYMSGINGAPCTGELKKKARQHWERENHHDHIVLGFTLDEKNRHDRFALTERSNILPVLIDEGISKAHCYMIINQAGIKPPEVYSLGFPNANCIGCVKATSATYWNHVRKVFPKVFDKRANLSRKIGCKLVRHQGKRIFLDELPPDARGRSMKTMNTECGLFCEELTR